MLSATACQVTNNVSLLVGLVTGVAISAVFFFIQNKIQRDVAFLTELYVARTCMFNLSDIFSGKSHKIDPTDEQRKKYLKTLKEDYIEKFHVKNNDVVQILKLASDHKIPETDHQREICPDCKHLDDRSLSHRQVIFHHQLNCTICRDLSTKIQDFLKKNQNPYQ